MRPSKLLLCGLLAVVLLPGSADAQLFRRHTQRTVTVQSGCPGGVCPTRQSTRQVVRAAPLQGLRWVYPSKALYVVPPVVIPAPTPAPVVPAPVPQASLPVNASEQIFELSVLVAAEIPSHVLAQIDDSRPTEVQESFRRNLAKAIAEARKAGKINARDAIKLRVSMLSPAFVERAQGLAVTQVAFSGQVSEHVPVNAEGVVQVSGINWDGLLKFLEVFVPLLLALLKSFGL